MRHSLLLVCALALGCSGLEYDEKFEPPPIVNAPVVVINAPKDGANLMNEVCLDGTASDAEDGDLNDQLVWSSNVDGLLGVGPTLCKELSFGNHTITATVTDSDGETTERLITIKVT